MKKNNIDLKKYQKKLLDMPCNICGSRDLKKLYKEERFSSGIRVVICKKCGLIFLNPRWTDEAYGKFYENDYRTLMGESKTPLEDCLENELMHGSNLVSFAGDFVKKGDLILDIGSSAGGILEAFRTSKQAKVEGLEPTLDRAEFCRKKLKIKVIEGVFETAKFKKSHYNMAVITQTLNHLYDPLKAMKMVHSILKPGGYFLVEVQNFPEYAKLTEQPTQVDHIYYFNPETVENLARRSGFQVVKMEIDTAARSKSLSRFLHGKGAYIHIRLLLRKAQERPLKKVKVKSILKSIKRSRIKNRFKVAALKFLRKI